jgi:flagellar hook protein FlgE
MMRSLFSGVAGLKAEQTGMDVIGNNIANVNTTGFKTSRVTFADTLNQTLSGASAPSGTTGGTNAKQVGLGASVSSIDTLFTDGSPQSTGNNTDISLSGSGLFVVKSTSGTYYTRNGAFTFDASGNYVTSGGLSVQGWMGSNGVVDTTGSTTNIQIQAGKGMPAAATTKGTYTNNLNANAATIVSGIQGGGAMVSPATATAASPITLTMSDGSTVTETSGTYSVSHSLPVLTTITVYDSLGTSHTVPVNFEKNGTANQWQLSLPSTTIDGAAVTLTPATSTVTFTTSGAYSATTGATIALTGYSDKAADSSISLDLTGLTQYAGSSTIAGKGNGNAAGTLNSVSIDSKGVITGTYSNGVKQSEAQVAVAQFNNSAGLTKIGSSLYQVSNNSGQPNVKAAADLGVTMTPSALEMSNVDLAQEFSNMIVTQRGYQANSKIITVSDEMLETLVNMKR